jgi:predicted nucleic acid-binding protein
MNALVDTSVFIAREAKRPLRSDPPTEVAVSVVAVGELRLGVLMAQDVETRHRRLATLELALSLDPLPIDDRVADVWAGLVAGLRAQGRRMPLNDSWIAATAMAHHLPVVTQDDNFDDVPKLAVIKL